MNDWLPFLLLMNDSAESLLHGVAASLLDLIVQSRNEDLFLFRCYDAVLDMCRCLLTCDYYSFRRLCEDRPSLGETSLIKYVVWCCVTGIQEPGGWTRGCVLMLMCIPGMA